MTSFFLGIGTGSCRAALVDLHGQILAISVKDILTFQSPEGHLEQSSDDIWKKICICVHEITHKLPENSQIGGIGVCATCSLVALDHSMEPISVSLSNKNEQNIILWMDHRAADEANVINKTGHSILKYVGGRVSLEMEIPKILWLKKHLPEKFEQIHHYFDLADFLTWKLTKSLQRSICPLVCKWNFDAINTTWCEDFFKEIGLSELMLSKSDKIGNQFLPPGDHLGILSDTSAKELGLQPGIPVASSLIDAHSGALALLGCKLTEGSHTISSKLAIIAGTSTCHMSITRQPVFPHGIWGPYFSAIFPKTYLNEAGQSTSGHLLDFIIESHPTYSALKNNFLTKIQIIHHLNTLLSEIQSEQCLHSVHEITRNFHLWPDFHGNRSPLADPNLKGMICGLSLGLDEKNLAKVYLATIQSLAYGTKHIIDTLYKAGREKFTAVLMCGGLSKNPIFVQTHADVLQIPIGLPETTEAVLLGASMLGAHAAGIYQSLEQTAEKMGGNAKVVEPDLSTSDYHSRKYKVFLKMVQDQIEYDRIMKCDELS